MNALAEVTDFGDSDDNGGSIDALDVLLRFAAKVVNRGPVFSTVVFELLKEAAAEVAEGE